MKTTEEEKGWNIFPTSQHFEGKRGMLEFQDGD